ncbi:MAG: serine/threonine-protein phosphatase [Candidatus Riflebacteria bacterium]|nr:serine/threonine-protein phosphatase [Candidatus Riflebacteria bacterium]
MSLRSRLALGIGGALAGLLVFLAFTTHSFRQIDFFINSSLFREIGIARTYERLAASWLEISDLLKTNLRDQQRTERLVPDGLLEQFEITLKELEAVMVEPSYRASFAPVQGLATLYLKTLKEFERLVAKRGALARREVQRRRGAGQAVVTKVGDLLERYRKMVADFAGTLKNPDFQASFGTTSTMLVKISRVEKDLDLAESEVALYLTMRGEGQGTASGTVDREGIAERVQKRLQAVTGFLSRSMEETTNPLQLRVFGSIRTRIQEFRHAFADLRDTLENADGEKLELDDQVLLTAQALEDLRRRGVIQARQEARAFWLKIDQTSLGLLDRIRSNQNAGVVLLGLALVLGGWFVTVFPNRIAGPIGRLTRAVREFELGKDLKKELQGLETGRIVEVDALATAFSQATERLNAQASLNQRYLETINDLNDIYRDLLSTKAEQASESRTRLEKAINSILGQVSDNIPQIDLVKLMLLREARDEAPSGRGRGDKARGDRPGAVLVRFGELQVRPDFEKNEEFLPYCQSVGWSPGPGGASTEECIPLGEGLSGWFFENMDPLSAGSDEKSFHLPSYQIQPISKYPVLAGREWEKGLNGCLLLEKIPKQSAPSVADAFAAEVYLGALFVYFSRPDTLLSWQDISFIKIMCGQIAAVIETDSLLDESEKKQKLEYQLSLAKEIQDNLLPRVIPRIPGLSVSRVNKSAAEVGGDYYDCFEVGPGRLGVVIADAAGKNVPAAILMTVFKTTLSTMSKETMTASEVLTKANGIILRNITSDRFITAMYAIIDAGTGEVEMACAGHNPALVVTGRGPHLTIQEKHVPGLPLGIAEVKYPSIRFRLERGDLFVLYTDGVTEARNPDREEFGLSGLKKFLAAPRSPSPAEDLLRVVEEFSQTTSQFDDITALTVEFQGPRA